LIDLEVGSVLRRQNRAGQISDRRAEMVLNDLAAIPVQRAAHRHVLGRCWELRQNLTIYDAAYVALAEALQVTLPTGDRRLAGPAGPSCPIETTMA
jgi:predicted nucleic acid-binding protein